MLKIGYIYFAGEDISASPTIQQIKYISHLFNESNITLMPTNGETFREILKSAITANDIVIVSNKFFDTFENENGDGLNVPVRNFFKNIDNYSTGAKLSCFVTYLKHKPVAVLSADNNENREMFSVLALDYLFNAENKFVAYGTFAATDNTLEQVNKILSDNCVFSNPHILVFDDKDIITLHIFATAQTQESADELLNDTIQNLKMLFGDECNAPTAADLAKSAVNLLLDKKLKIATAESCTAGMLSAAITSVKDASKIFEIGISSYSNRIKSAALGVGKDTIDLYGAISMQTAVEMAAGIRELGVADIGIGITGVAGPLPSEGHPVGTVYIALTNGRKNWVVKHEFGDKLSREEVRERATVSALDLLRRYLQCLPGILPEGTDADKPAMLIFKNPDTTQAVSKSTEIVTNIFDDIFSDSDKQNYTTDINDDIFAFDAPDALGQEVVIAPEKKSFKEKLTSFTRFNFKSSKLYPLCLKFLNLYNFKSDFTRAAGNTFLSIVVLVIVLSTVFFIQYFSQATANDKLISEIRSVWSEDAAVNDEGKLNSIIRLQAINPDITGWISIADTEINNPVCQTDNNSFYLNHNFKRKSSRYGSLFFTKESSVTSNVITQNTVIYGKNAKNGTMFGGLKDLKDLSYISEKNIINLTTLYGKSTYRIFSVMILADSPGANGSDFNYSKTSFTDQDDFKLWIAEVKQRSLFNIIANITYTSQFLTLVTESTEFDGAKLVIVAQKQDATDISNNISISVNPSPRYPQIWYDNHNTQNPYADYVASPDFELNSDTTSSEDAIIIVPSPDVTSSDETEGATSSSTSSNTSTTSSTTSTSNTSSNTQSGNGTSSGNTGNSKPTDSTSSDTSTDAPVSSNTSDAESNNSNNSESSLNPDGGGTTPDDDTSSDNTTE